MSMAWGARNLISTQVAAAARGAFATWLVREGAELRDVVDLLRFPARRRRVESRSQKLGRPRRGGHGRSSLFEVMRLRG